ncbi:MAG: 6-pyruvoyl-tetrahydropterin synthase-related protein [Anaerolineae bacterium]
MNKDRLGILFGPLRLRWSGAPALLVWLLPVFAWAPLTSPGYPELQSGFLPVFNLVDLLSHWRVWGWVPLIGRPFDGLRGEGSLPYLLAALFRLLGASPPDAVKLVFAISILAGAVGMYRWARQWLPSWPALVAAMAYVYWPVGLATVYVRGALAEAVLLGLLPWVLGAAQDLRSSGFSRFGRLKSSLQGGVLALGLAVALWTQAGLGLWLAALLLGSWLMGVVSRPKPQVDMHKPTPAAQGNRGLLGQGWFLASWAAGLALAALGALPVLLRRGWGGASYVTFREHFVYPHQLLWPGWGHGPSIPGPDDTLTFSLGIIVFGLAVTALAHPGRSDEPERHQVRREVLGCLVPALFLIFLSSTLATAVWDVLPALSRTLTYPWQLLLLVGPWLAQLAGMGAQKLDALLPVGSSDLDSGRGVVSTMLIALILLAVYGNLRLATSQVPVPSAPVAIFGQDEIALLRVRTVGAPGPGGRVTVAVEWQALRPLGRDYTVFFHVLGPDGTRYGQQDTMPLAGRLPTSRWQPGQVVADQYTALLPANAPVSDAYRYWLGFYLSETGERLSTSTDDKVVLQP